MAEPRRSWALPISLLPSGVIKSAAVAVPKQLGL
jgi:hypothetical protein